MSGARSSRFMTCVTLARLTSARTGDVGVVAHQAGAKQLVQVDSQSHEARDSWHRARGGRCGLGCQPGPQASPAAIAVSDVHLELDGQTRPGHGVAPSLPSALIPAARKVTASVPFVRLYATFSTRS